ncbi:MAG TPA: N-acetylmuramoyl-L-alanine amidase [Drouetiella sp.]
MLALAPVGALAERVVVLDPGHSGKDERSIDKETGLSDHDYPNHPEMEECFRVAKRVGEQLEKSGYKVVYTKKNVDDTVSLRERSNIAKSASAALAVSIHNDHGQKYKAFAQVYKQAVGQWRGGSEDKPKVTFKNDQIAQESTRFAKIFATERSKTEHHKVSVTPISFNNRPGIEPGNIPQVMLFAGTPPDAIPWIYNEVGGVGFDETSEREYADGIAAAIRKCLPNETGKKSKSSTSATK